MENDLHLQASTEISRTVWTWTLCVTKKKWTLSAILLVALTFWFCDLYVFDVTERLPLSHYISIYREWRGMLA